MGFLDTIRSQQRALTFRQPAQQEYKAQYDNLPTWLRATGEAHAYDMLNTPESQARLYATLSWIQTAIDNVATSAITSALKVKSKKGTDGNEKDIDNHEFEQLLQRPNPAMSRSEFMESTVSFRALTGNAYWWLNRRSEKAKPDEIWIVPPHQIRPVPDGKLFVKGYLYDPGDGKEIPLENWEIVHFKRFNPQNMFIGLSAVESLQLVAQGDLAAQAWNTNYFAKDNAKLPGALAFSDPIDDDAWARMRNDIEHTYGGTKRKLMMLRNAGKGGVQWLNMSVSQREMEFLNGRQFNKEEIFSALAPGLVSILDKNATEANATAGKNTFIEFAVWPHLVHIAEKITNDIMPMYGENLIAEFEDIRVTDRSMTLAEQNAFAQVHTIDEIRAEFYQNKPIGDDRGTLLLAEVVPLARASSGSAADANALDLTGGTNAPATPGTPPLQPTATVAQPAALLTDGKPADVAKPADTNKAQKAATEQALKAATAKAHSSAMIALFMPKEAADALLTVQSLLPINSTLTPPDEFHVTLSMLGEVADMDTRMTVTLQNVLFDFSSSMSPLVGRFNGIGRFQGVGDGGADALYVTFDSKELAEWRLDLITRLRVVGIESPSEHGFIPHITLGYIPTSAVTPLIVLPQFDIVCNDVWLALGDSQQSWTLQGATISANAEELAEEVKRFKRWLKKRNNADVSKFASNLLTDEHKAQLIESMTVTQAKGDGSDQPFFTLADGRITPDVYAGMKALILQSDPSDDEAESKIKLKLEELFVVALGKVLLSQKNDLLPNDASDESIRKAPDRVDKTSGKVKDVIQSYLQKSVELGLNISSDQLAVGSISFDWDLAHKNASKWVEDYSFELVSGINDTTRSRLQSAVDEWFQGGQPLSALSESLTPLFGESRSRLIASTETTRAAAMGSLLGYKEAGFGEGEPTEPIPQHPGCRCWYVIGMNDDGSAYYIFRTANDERTCEICGPLEGRAVGVAKSVGY